jgi:hypothetical protein
MDSILLLVIAGLAIAVAIGLLRWLLRINDAIDLLAQIARKLDDISEKLDKK